MPENPDSPGPRANPSAISLADAARLLTRVSGQPVTIEMLQADLDAGAPVNRDRTMNLIHFAAWLIREIHRGD